MRLSDFQYELPGRLIAQSPADRRTGSRMLVIDRARGAYIDSRFERLAEWLAPGDCLVFNDTKVMPARLIGRKEQGGAAVEALLVRPLGAGAWEAMVRPGKRLGPGARVEFGGGRLHAEVTGVLPSGHRALRFDCAGAALMDAIQEIGRIPLPPYITNENVDAGRYQTVYARHLGSAAAPTAGLHFTGEFIAGLEAAGVSAAYVTLHVGPGTFRPVKAENIEEHRMHEEFYRIGADAAQAIDDAEGRVVAVGTTSMRTVEGAAGEDGRVRACEGWTGIFIYPGYRFRRVGALLTNFHLPGSTLLMLVCAFAGYDLAMAAYRHAVEQEYRFFSFGDAMLIV